LKNENDRNLKEVISKNKELTSTKESINKIIVSLQNLAPSIKMMVNLIDDEFTSYDDQSYDKILKLIEKIIE